MYCPVALAIGEAFPEITNIWVDGEDVSFRLRADYDKVTLMPPAGARWMHLPQSARRAIGRIDSGEQIEPFSFYLEMPE
jgi:hypothetical protein